MGDDRLPLDVVLAWERRYWRRRAWLALLHRDVAGWRDARARARHTTEHMRNLD